ncbi:TonB-dependent receptor domain-containing protein [Corallococcus terminator]|uniref:TonB-dependent receptor n=1 Tax=Corallococcus terminator TaxID=2316733 RepID=A0A3A8HUH4_9BACT|nr:TonB-dependent receptor [Corallococcus terminator]RKG74208.1 TonB-dependent receptor [Corallococcus terminator]
MLSRSNFVRALVASLVLITQPAFAQAPGAEPTAPLAPSPSATPGTQPAGEIASPPGTPGGSAASQPDGALPTSPAPSLGTQPGSAANPASVSPESTQPGAVASAQAAQPVDPSAPAAAQSGTEADPSAATASDEAAMGDEALAESAAPPPGFTGIYGRLTDEANGEGLIEATVKVVTGSQKQALTDLDGNYRLALPPGKYDLRAFYDVYQGRRITGVIVTQGKATKLDVALSADVGAVQEVVVEARSDRRAEGALLQDRKKAAAVSDAISAQEIARTPDSSAGDAVKRVVSATVVDGKYVLLRGLGGRYATTLLNGALLPSPEPDEPSVPLDLFPTSLLANLNVVKSYTPDLPGTFGGGTLLIETNTYPSQFEFKPRLTLGGDTVTTFRERNSQAQGGFGEALGFADSSRGLPSELPRDHRLGAGGESAQQLEGQWESFTNVWEKRTTRAVPNLGLGASLGDTLRFGNQRLGYLATVNYGHRDGVQTGDFARASRDESGSLIPQDVARTTQGFSTANLSGLASVGYQFDRDNELTFFSLYTRGTDTRTYSANGNNNVRGDSYASTRLQFITRALSFTQLRGFHRLGLLGDSELDWQANVSRVDRDEPDTRDTLYSASLNNPDAQLSFPNQPNSGERFFAELGETSTGGSVNLTLPFSSDLRVKVGGLTQVSFRDFNARRFRYLLNDTPVDRTQSPEQLFSPENVGTSITVRETTRADDAYNAFLGIYAGYVSADYKPVEPLRLVGGVRLEASRQNLTLKDPFTGVEGEGGTDQRYLDVLPSFNAIYALSEKVNLRAGYSYTLARPTFRELAPFIFFDFVRRRNVSGNPDLLETRIHNVDARVEWFVEENDVLAASAFYKRFQDPIERVIRNPDSGDLGFENAAGADSYGLELEARTSLARFSPSLRPVRVGANLTLIQSQVDLGDSAVVGAQTNKDRPLQGQSPYVINVNVGYERPESGTEFAVLYNVYGQRISEVGVQGLPDVYERPFHRVDITLTQKLGATQLKLTAANLLNASVTLRQGDVTVQTYKPGMAFTAALGWAL